MKRKFNVGDIVRGMSNDYGITNKAMTKGEVINVYDARNGEYEITVKILEHCDSTNVGKSFTVNSKKFELVKKNIKIPGLDIVKVIQEDDATFLVLGNKVTIAVPKNTSFGIASKDNDDEFNEEIGKALAFYRMKEDK